MSVLSVHEIGQFRSQSGRQRVRCFSLLLCLLIVTVTAGQGIAADGVKTAPRRVIAVTPVDLPPTFFLDAGGKPAGFAIDVLNALAARADLAVEYVTAQGWEEAIRMVLTGKADLIPSLTINEKRKELIALSSPTDFLLINLMVASGNQSIQEISPGLTIGVLRGSAPHDMLQQNHTIKLEVFSDRQTMLFALLAGRVDGIVSLTSAIRRLASEAGLEEKIKVVGKPVIEARRAIALRKDDPELLARLNSAIDVFVNSPEYRQLYVKWYGKPKPYWTTGRIAWTTGALLALLTVIVILGRLRAKAQAEAVLRRSEEKFRSLFESARDGIFILNASGNIVDMNASFAAMHGYTVGEMKSMKLSELDTPEISRLAPERFQRLFAGEHLIFEVEHYCKDGRILPLEVSVHKVCFDSEEYLLGFHRDITDRRRTAEELRQKTVQLEDLTRNLEQRVSEEMAIRRKNEEILVQQSKLATMGEMMGAISHQWRQPLNALGLIVQNIAQAHEYGELDRAYIESAVERAMEQVTHMSTTIDDFRNFFKPDKEAVAFDTMEAIGEVLSLLSAQLKANDIEFRLTCHTHGKTFTEVADIVPCAEKTAWGFRNEFEHAVLNIINNARDAIVERRAHDPAAGPGLFTIDFYRDQTMIVIKIGDNGGGISRNILDRIFEPYFTTKGPAQGTGIGLYMSRVIMGHMQGRLQAGNRGQGAEFTIEIPAAH